MSIQGIRERAYTSDAGTGSGKSILDAGCETGIFTADILETGATVVGLELALSMLQRARTRLAQQAFQQAGQQV